MNPHVSRLEDPVYLPVNFPNDLALLSGMTWFEVRMKIKKTLALAKNQISVVDIHTKSSFKGVGIALQRNTALLSPLHWPKEMPTLYCVQHTHTHTRISLLILLCQITLLRMSLILF